MIFAEMSSAAEGVVVLGFLLVVVVLVLRARGDHGPFDGGGEDGDNGSGIVGQHSHDREHHHGGGDHHGGGHDSGGH
jgi:hypothetical protein